MRLIGLILAFLGLAITPAPAQWAHRVQNAGGKAIQIYATMAAFQSALGSMPAAAPGTSAIVQRVAPTSAYQFGTCGLTFIAQSSPSGVFGELFGGGVYWKPQYSLSSVRACEFGVVGDASYTVNASAGAAVTANGTNTVTVTSSLAASTAGGPRVGWNITCFKWHSLGCALPSGTKITSVTNSGSVMTTITLSTTLAAGTYNLVPYILLSTANVTGTDNATIIQAAIDYAAQNAIERVVMPDGQFYTSKTIHLGYGDAYRTLWFDGAGIS